MSITPEQRAVIGDTVLTIANPNADSDALHFGLRNDIESSICAIHASLGWAELFHVVEEFEAAAIVKAQANGLFDVAVATDVQPVIEGVSAEATVIDVTPAVDESPAVNESAAVDESPAADESVDLAAFTQEQFAQNNPPADGGAQ